MRFETAPMILAIVAVSMMLVLAEVPRDTWLTLATFSLALGVAAFALMATAALLGSRSKHIESWFGGLDRLYRTHKWLGIAALALACGHFAFKAGLDVWDSAAIVELPGTFRRLVRQLSLVALMGIVILALNRNIPYSQWRWWHKLSGPAFLIVILHWSSIESPIRLASPAGIWLTSLSVLGVGGAAYKLLLYPFLARHAEYRVVSVTRGPSALQLELAPLSAGVTFEPGQFGFLRMHEEGLREPHPFTIASGGESGAPVRFVIRALGDYTQRLIARAAPGMHADIYAPYGRFHRPTACKREVWIGGGVGISPFIAWLSDASASDFDRVTLFYFFTPGREFPSVEVLEELARQRGASFVPVADDGASVRFPDRFAELARSVGPAHVDIRFCGPKGLLQRVRDLMRRNDIPESHLEYEFFEFR